MTNFQDNPTTILVTGATGKTGRRVTHRLRELGHQVRAGSRTPSAGSPRFDWLDDATWAPALTGASAVYIAYAPDVCVPGAVDAIGRFTALATRLGVSRLVLLSGRGEPEAQRAERVVQEAAEAAGAEWTVVRCAWFAQNFSESFLREQVVAGEVVLPAGDVGERFVDADDIADVAVAALTDTRAAGQLYELSGPRLLSFAQAVHEIAQVSGRSVRYRQVTPEQHRAALQAAGLPPSFVWLLDYLFSTVLDGRNAHLTDGVQRALCRPPRDFADQARAAAAAGAW